MMRTTCSLLLVALIAVPSVATGQQRAGFRAGWYIVQPTAEFSPIQLAVSEITRDSAQDAAIYEQVSIRAGEVVIAFEASDAAFLVFEYFGRMSAIRGADALLPAPTDGRPALLTQDVEFMDRVLAAGSAVWLTNINAAAQIATIVLDGDRRETIPSSSVTILMNAYSRFFDQLTFKPVPR